MSSVRALGQTVRPLESVAVVGSMFGMSKATSYRTAEAEEWPRHAHRVVVPALLDRLGIAYEFEEAADDH